MSEVVSETLRPVTPYLGDERIRIVGTLREGRLYLAERAGKRFVLKTCDGSARALELLKREYELSLRVQHPFIAASLGWEAESPVGPAMAVEYIQGRTLSDFLREKPSAKARRRVFGQLLEAVAAIHRQSLIHNDLKPSNILITSADDDVKLIDFGFADSDTHFAHKGIGGTRAYASPELLAQAPTDARSDIWSLGLLLRDLFPRRYRHIARRCCRPRPERRYLHLDALKAAWRRRNLPLWMLLSAILCIAALVVCCLPERRELSDPVPVEAVSPAATTGALEAAKAEVDAWYAAEVPAFLDALSRATSQNEAAEAWAAFAAKTSVINTDIPARTPEAELPALREYLVDLYNAAFPALQDSLAKKMRELGPQ